MAPAAANFLERNLTALARVDPQLAERLRKPVVNPKGPYLVGANGVPELQDARGTGIDPKPSEALLPDADEAWIARLPQDARVLLVASIARGERVDALLQASALPLMVCERYSGLLTYALSRFNWSRHISSRRLRFFLTDEVEQQRDVTLTYDLVAGLAEMPGIAVVGGSPWWERVFAGEIIATPLFPGLASLLESLFPALFPPESGLIARSERLVSHYAARPSLGEIEKLRVLAVVHESTAAVKTILARLVDGFNEIGHEASLYLENCEPDLHSRRMSAVLDFKPDIFINAIYWPDLNSGWLGNVVTLPGVTWATDAPWLALRPGSPSIVPTSVFAPEQQYGDWVSKTFGMTVHPLPLATSYPGFTPVAADQRRNDITFIGNIADPEGRLAALSRPTLDRLIEMFWEERDDAACGDLQRFTERAVRIAGWSAPPTGPQHVLWGTVYRLSALEALAGLPVSVYGGKAWETLLRDGPLKGAWKGWLEPERELPAVMAAALVNLNLTSLPNYYSGNMRTYDAAGVGSCVLHDRKRDVLAQFAESEEMEYFSDRADLRSKAEQLLADPQAANRIAAAGFRVVNDRHCYRHRAAQITATVRSELGTLRAVTRSQVPCFLRRGVV